jgi:UDPglucose--hexose-1-phosphate uridylyltransferase
MGELRKDYILDRYAIIATERGRRPHQFEQKPADKKVDMCFFCPGNENTTPPEIGRTEANGKWKMRWFPNKFPAVQPKGNFVVRTDNTFFTFSDAFGYHEVIVETPDHEKELADLSVQDIKELLKVYALRINELGKKEGVKYVCLFKNSGKEAGTSIIHTHTQIITCNHVPKDVDDEIWATCQYPGCPYCSIIEIEKGSFRRCYENRTFVAFAPYASRFPFEIWVFPKRHVKTMDELRDDEYNDFADIMSRILKKLHKLNAPYNFFIHYAPEGKDLHLHLEVTPRLATWAGFELSSGVIINAMPPEQAAEYYRE